MEDNELIHRCKKGEKAAFQQLICKYHPLVLKFLLKITENNQLAEDLTQEVFIKVIKNIDKFEINGKAKFYTYIIAISRNCYIDYLRKEKKYEFGITDDRTFLEAASPNFEDAVVEKIYGQAVLKQIDNLSEEQKIVIKLKYIEGLTLKEIGDMLNLEPKTVKSRIHNGIAKLRQILALRGEKND